MHTGLPMWCNHQRGDLRLDNSKTSGSIGLVCANIGGNLIADNAVITCSTTAILARQASVAGSLRAVGKFTCTGGINMEGVHIAGQFIMNDAKLSADKQPTLNLDHSRIDLGIALRRIRADGSIFLHHARVGCQVSFTGAKLSNPGKVVLRADHLVVDGSLLLYGDTEIKGEINLHGAEISCTLNIGNVKIDASGSEAIRAESIHVGHNLVARDCHIKGSIGISDSTVGGSMLFADARLDNPYDYALNARRLKVVGRVDMTGNFSARGTVSLADATVGTNFSFEDGKFSEAKDRACLNVTGLQVQGDVVGNRVNVDGFFDAATLKCSGDVRLADAVLKGVPANVSSLGSPIDKGKGGIWRGISMRLIGAVVGGDLDMRGANLERSLVLTKATITRSILLTNASLNGTEEGALIADGVTANYLTIQLKSSPAGVVNLESAHISTLSDGNKSWPISAPIYIDGFKYERLDSDLSASERLRWLVRATAKYTPQPYEQLASYYVASGDADEARRIVLSQLDALIESVRHYLGYGDISRIGRSASATGLSALPQFSLFCGSQAAFGSPLASVHACVSVFDGQICVRTL